MRRLAAVGIALLGLWTALQGITTVFASLSLSSSSGDGIDTAYQVGFYLVPAVLLLASGLTLIAFRDRMAGRWFSDESLDLAIEPATLLRLGLILVGLVFSITAVESLLFVVVRPVILGANARAVFGPGMVEPEPLVTLLPAIVARAGQLVIGLLLAWFAAPLARWLWTHEANRDERDLPACLACGAKYDPDEYESGRTARCTACGESLDLNGA